MGLLCFGLFLLIFSGAYDDETAAAHAYDLAALKYWGQDTILNFPVRFSFINSFWIWGWFPSEIRIILVVDLISLIIY